MFWDDVLTSTLPVPENDAAFELAAVDLPAVFLGGSEARMNDSLTAPALAAAEGIEGVTFFLEAKPPSRSSSACL
jgi:hypothetical protein